MAAPTFIETGYITLIDVADSTGSSWSISDVDTDIKVEGVGAHYDAIRDGGTLTYSFGTSQDMSATNAHIRVWFQHTFPANLDLKVNGGLRLSVVDSTNNTNEYYVGGSDTHKGSWEILQADLSAPDVDGSATLSSIDEFAIELVHATAARNVNNTYWDVSWYGIGIAFSGGTSGDKVTWGTLALADTGATTSKQYGIVELVRGGAYYLNSGLWVGDNAGTASTYFDGTNETIIFYAANEKTGSYKLIGQGNATGTTDIDLSGAVIKAASTPFIFDMSDSTIDLTMDGGSISNASQITFGASQTLTGVVISSSDAVDPNGATLTGFTITNTTETVTGSLELNSTVEATAITDISFQNYAVNTRYALYIPAAVTTVTLTGYVFDSPTSTYCLYWAGTGGTLTVNKGAGTNLGSAAYTSAGGTVTITASYNHVIEGLELNTEVTYVTANTSTELFHVENAATSDGNGKYKTTYSHSGGASVDILIHHINYQPDISNIYNLTLPSTDATVKVQMFEDVNYSNP